MNDSENNTQVLTATENISDKTPKKPDATLQIILAIVNIAVCGSFVLGVIALIFAIIASGENDYEQAENKIRIAMILNIVGISLSVLTVIVVFAILFFTVGISSLFMFM